MDGPGQRAADVSVDHPLVLEHYRTAHDIAIRQTKGEASTEDLRQAMIHYRSLFEELVGEPETPPMRVASQIRSMRRRITGTASSTIPLPTRRPTLNTSTARRRNSASHAPKDTRDWTGRARARPSLGLNLQRLEGTAAG